MADWSDLADDELRARLTNRCSYEEVARNLPGDLVRLRDVPWVGEEISAIPRPLGLRTAW